MQKFEKYARDALRSSHIKSLLAKSNKYSFFSFFKVSMQKATTIVGITVCITNAYIYLVWVWTCVSKPTFVFSKSFFFFQHVNSNITWIYSAGDKKHYSRIVHALFTDPTALFIHLKIILLQCLQFSISVKINCIQTDSYKVGCF